jgi:hypothetical protein
VANTIPMHNPETGKSADVHPAEVVNWKAVGWRLSEPSPLPPPPPVEKPLLTLPKGNRKA